MPKSTNVKCDKCQRSFKSMKYLNQHICNENKKEKKNEKIYINCFYCSNIYDIKNINRHEESCKKIFYLEPFIFFIKFMFNLISRANKSFLKQSIVSDDEEKKNIIYKYKMNNIINNINIEYKEKNDKFKQDKINKLLDKEKKYKTNKNYIEENKIILNKSINNEIETYNKEGINEMKKKYKKIKDDKIIEYISNINNCFIPLISIRQIFEDYFNRNKKYNDISKLIIDYLNKKYTKKDFLTDKEIKKIDIELYNKIKKTRLNCEIYYNKYVFLYNIIEKNFKHRNYYKCEFCNIYVLNKLIHFRNCKELPNYYKNKKQIIEYIINNYYIDKLCNTNFTIEYYINYYKNKKLDEFLKNINMHIIKNYKYDEYQLLKNFKNNNKYNIFKILREIEKNKEIEEKKKTIELNEEEEEEINEKEEINDEEEEINEEEEFNENEELDNDEKIEEIEQKELSEENSIEEIINKIEEINEPKKRKINLSLETNPFQNYGQYYLDLIKKKRERELNEKYNKNIKYIYNYKKNETDILKKREILDKKFNNLLINNK